MNKEIREYQESVFFGLDLRQCVFSVLAVGAALGIYFGLRDITADEVTGWLSMLGAAPFAACGFFRYHGMTAERFLWAVVKSELLCPRRLTFQSENLYYACLEECIRMGDRTGKDRAEALAKKRIMKERKEERCRKRKQGECNQEK